MKNSRKQAHPTWPTVGETMSVLRVRLLAQGSECSLDEFGRATIKKRYEVETTSDTDLEHTVLIGSTAGYISGYSGTAIPKLLTQYDLDHGAGEISGTTDSCAWLLKKRAYRATQDEGNRRLWYVDCEWGPLPLGWAGGTGTGAGPVIPQVAESQWNASGKTPLNDPVIARSEYEHYTRHVDFDINGSAIVNSAGDPLTANVDDVRPVLVFVKNMWPESAVDALIAQYKNATNYDTFRGHNAGTLKIAGIKKGPLQERMGVQFFPVTVRMHIAEAVSGAYGTNEYWNLKLADRGGQHLEGYTIGTGTAIAGYRKVWPTVAAGSSYGEFLDIVNLNSDGTRKADGLGPDTKQFSIYPSLPFSALGLT